MTQVREALDSDHASFLQALRSDHANEMKDLASQHQKQQKQALAAAKLDFEQVHIYHIYHNRASINSKETALLHISSGTATNAPSYASSTAYRLGASQSFH